jgi:1-deoxy-D-xylulose-5-phosphate synthase
MAPKDENELQHMLRTAVEYDGPAAVRYPRGAGFGVPLDQAIKAIPVGESELLRDGDDALIVAYGTLVHPALEAAAELVPEGISAAVLNARFAKPLDEDRILSLARRCKAVVTVEEHSGLGGFGSAVLEALSAASVVVASRCLGVPDRVIEHGDAGKIRQDLRLDAEGIARAVRDLVKRSAAEEC